MNENTKHQAPNPKEAPIAKLQNSASAVDSVFGFWVLAYSVQRRTREFGIRLALGSTPVEVLGLVMKEGIRLALVGLAFGLAGGLLGARLIASQLYGVTPRDPMTLAILILVLLLAAATASFIPGRRATKINPMEALRYE